MRIRRALIASFCAIGMSAVGGHAYAANWTSDTHVLAPGDFNNDGRSDLLVIANDASQPSGIALGDTGTNQPSVFHQSWASNWLGISWSGGTYIPHVGDFNGDTYDDVFLQRTSGGDHYVLLTDPTTKKLTAIHQTISNTHLGVNWSSAERRIVVGDFNNTAEDDLFLQANAPGVDNVVALGSYNGPFQTVSPPTPWANEHLTLEWSLTKAIDHAGDFDNDGKADWFVHAKPTWVMIPFDDLSIPVPVYRPESYGIVLSDGTGRAATVSDTWNHDYLGFEWSPLHYDAFVGNFDGQCGADILLQAKRAGDSSRIILVNCSGQVPSNATVHVLGAGVSWDQQSYQLRIGDFDGNGRADIYMQAMAGGTNRIAYTASSGNVTTTPATHTPGGNFKKPVPGAIAGGFAVGSNGEGTYTIPIEAPAATGGLKPSLALSYNHLAGSGLAGMGWNLAGIAAITRCGRTFAQDGSVVGITYTNADAFCLNGQRLVTISGTHGTTNAEYRTEIESFQRIVQLDMQGSSPHSFRVDHGNGLSSYFGATEDSRVEVSSGSGAVKLWYISHTEDRFGNQIKYSYTESVSTGEAVPSEVAWTARTGLTPKYRVTITYEARPDARSGHDTAGMAWANTKRIDKIDVVYNTTQLIRSYDLTYDVGSGTGRSRLAQVQLCGPNECMPATTLTVSNGTSGWTAMSDTGYSSGTGPVFAADVNSDGRQDIVVVGSNGNWQVHYGTAAGSLNAAVDTGVSAGPNPFTARVLDFHSAGLDELLFKSTTTWKVMKLSGATFTLIDTGVSTNAPTHASIADYDGDGIDDWLYQESGFVKWRRNTGGSFASAQTLLSWSGLSLYDHPNRRAPDFNGDGRNDVIHEGKHCEEQPEGGELCTPVWTVLVASGTGSYSSIHQLQGGITADIFFVNAVDLNGDGLDDLMFVDTNTWYTQLSTATGFAAPVATGISWVSAQGAIFADYDNDGREDYLRSESGTTYIHRSNGSTVPTTPTASLSSAGLTVVADISGDGFADLIGTPFNSSLRVHKHQTALPDVITGVTNGLGYHVSVQYESLVNSANYTLNGVPTSVYTRPLKFGRHAVTAESHDNGIGGTRTFSHFYDTAHLDVSGRGWLAFATHRVNDVARGTSVMTEYSQSFPTVGHVTKQQLLKTSGDQLIREVVHEVQATAIGGTTPNRQFVRTEEVMTKEYEVGGVANGQQLRAIFVDPEYDSTYGYLTSTTRTVADAPGGSASWTSQTVFTRPATPLTTPWCLDVPELVTTTNTMVPATSTAPPRKIRYTRDPTTCAVTETRDESDTSDPAKQLKTRFTYDSYGNPNVTTLDDVTGPATARTTDLDFDTSGQFPTSVTVGGVGLTTQMTFNPLFGTRASVTGPDGLMTSFLYDDFGRVTKETRPAGHTSFTYEDCWTCWPQYARFTARAQGSDGSDAYQFFDKLARPVGSSWTLPQASQGRRETRYDALGQVEKTSQPYLSGAAVYWVNHTYDLLGRVLTETQPDSSRTTAYDYRGLERWVTDAENHTTKYVDNAAGQIKQVIDALNGTTSYTYQPFGELATVLDVESNTTTIGYDARGFKTSMADPNMGSWSYDTNVFGELASQTNGAGQQVTLAYDAAGRLATRTEPEGTTTFTYHGASVPGGTGKPSTISKTNHSETYTYDPATGQPSRIRRTLDGTQYDFDFTFDSHGRLDVMSYPDIAGYRFKVDYDFDAAGNLSVAKDGNTGSLFYVLSSADALGRETFATFGSGVTEQRAFDPATLALTSIDTGPSGSSTLQDLAFTWDKVGNLKTRTNAVNGKTETLVYDALDRLTSAQVTGLSAVTTSYSAAGRITAKSDVPGTWTYGAGAPGPYALTSVGSTNYDYDLNGRMTSHGSGDTFEWYSYDLPKTLAAGTKSAEFSYGVGRDRYKQVQKTSGTTDATIYYVGSLFEKETAGSTTTYRHYVSAGDRVIAQVSRVGTANTTQYLHRDHQSSVVEVTSSSGALVQSLAFDAWGLRRNASTWAALGSPFGGSEPTERGYTGHEHLDQVELVHMNGRVQDPRLGRFLSADPLVQAPYHSQSLNRYSYVWNNPASLLDSSGFQTEDPYQNPRNRCYWTPNDEPCLPPVLPTCEAHTSFQGATIVNDDDWVCRGNNLPAMVSTVAVPNITGFTFVREAPQGGQTIGPTSWRTDFFVFNPVGQVIARPFDLVAPFWTVDGQQVNPVSGEFMSMERQQEAAVLSVAGGAFGALRGVVARGTATVIEHAGSHASVLVRSGNTVLHTEQIVGAGGQTTIAVVENAAPAVRSLTVSLPDAAAAMRYQQSVLGQATGTYNAATNSCVTHCGDVLRAGGLEAPSTTRRIVTWLRGLGGD